MKEIPKKLPGSIGGGGVSPLPQDGPCVDPPYVPGRMLPPDPVPEPWPCPGPDQPYEGPVF